MLHQAVQGVIVIGTIIAIQGLVMKVNLFADISGNQFGVLIGGCVCDSLAMISMCIAFQAANTSLVSMVGYLAIVYAIITDVCFFGDTLSTIELLGCGLVLIITIIVGWYKSV